MPNDRLDSWVGTDGGKRGRGRSIAMETIAALMWGPKTVCELAQSAGASEATIRRLMSEAAESGVVYRKRLEKSFGRKPFAYYLQQKPFEKACDAPCSAD